MTRENDEKAMSTYFLRGEKIQQNCPLYLLSANPSAYPCFHGKRRTMWQTTLTALSSHCHQTPNSTHPFVLNSGRTS